MRFSVLASSSKANCTFVETTRSRFLVDCGLSARQIERRLLSIGVSPDTIDAILITHEHGDHIRGARVFNKRFRVPVYANQSTAEFLPEQCEIHHFETGEAFELNGCVVAPFQIIHDAADPVGFVLSADGSALGHVTDLGKVTTLVREAISHCHAVVLESNYDETLLQECHYPWEVKQRISSLHGHLSNTQASKFLRELRTGPLKHVVLGHLSENSNTPEHALKTVERFQDTDHLETLVCGQVDQPTDVIDLNHRDLECSVVSSA